jgi:transketolase
MEIKPPILYYMVMEVSQLQNITKLLRYLILDSTTKAGSGHPTSSMSAVELMTALMWSDYFKYDVSDPKNTNNDRLIFSKGHASPLFYSLWAVAGGIPFEEMDTLRKFESRLEGHPTMKFPFTVAPTGSLGQGLAIGAGMAYSYKYLDKLNNNVYVLLGDGESAEGSVWETAMFAAHYKLNNLVAILDVSRLEQTGETMYGWSLENYVSKFNAFGWESVVCDDGNSLGEVITAYGKLMSIESGKPRVLIAKTVKGKGVSFMENVEGMHGKALDSDQFTKAIEEVGSFEKKTFELKAPLARPSIGNIGSNGVREVNKLDLTGFKEVATRKAYGQVLKNIYEAGYKIVVLDAGVGDSTHSKDFKSKYPGRFIECYIQEQNMAGIALGLERAGNVPYISTFSAFLTRCFDQLRMAALAESNIKIIGTHGGVSIGADGSSQMGLEDISLARSLWNSTVYYPSDAYEAEKALILAVKNKGITYIRLNRGESSVLHNRNDVYGDVNSFTLRSNVKILSAGITLDESIEAAKQLESESINVQVMGIFKVKPLKLDPLDFIDGDTVLVVEDHYQAGGLGEAVRSALEGRSIKVYSMFVGKMPQSGTPEELYEYEGLNSKSIAVKVKEMLSL